MKLWRLSLTLILCWAQTGLAWDESQGLILNKKGDKFSFPRHVQVAEGGSYIRYKDPEDTDTDTYVFCNTTRPDNKGHILTGKLLSEQDTTPSCPSSAPSINPIQEIIDDNRLISCGTKEEQNGDKHTVYYKLYETDANGNTIKGKEQSLILYEYCFHDETKEISYVEFTIETPQLLRNEILRDEQMYEFPLIAIENKLAIDDYKKNYYNVPRMVGVPEFMPFALARKPFYLYDSSAPLNNELIEVWNEFLLKVKEKISKKTDPIKVYSGVFDRKRVHGSSQYLNSEKLTRPSPYAYWVSLYNQDESQGITLIMQNYAFDIFEERPKLACSKSVCEETGLQDILPNTKKYKFASVYCCPASIIANLYVGITKTNNLFEFME